MQSLIVALLSLIVASSAFTPVPRVQSFRSLKMSDVPAPEPPVVPAIPPFNAKAQPGSTFPFIFFDPLGLAPPEENDFKRYRESELKHGRIAMLAAVGLLVGESGLTFFGSDINGPAIYQYQQAESLFNAWSLNVVGLALAIEGYNIVNGWQSPGEYATIAGLKTNYVNGDLKFDPLGLKPKNSAEFETLQNKELNNGRLAMIATVGIIVQELATGKKLF